MDIQVFYESTPNPQTLKFIVTSEIAQESVQFSSTAEAHRSPLAQKILGFPWAKGVFIGPNFVSVTKEEWVEWQIIADPLAELIREHLLAGIPVLMADTAPREDDRDNENDSPAVRMIKKILREEIRPAVAMDGGDIVFDRYEENEGRVHLHMRGACAGCPSSTFTLKEGIETRLKEAVPEIQEVVSV